MGEDLHAYIFMHHHKMEYLIAAFLEDSAPKLIICDEVVHDYYRDRLGSHTETLKFGHDLPQPRRLIPALLRSRILGSKTKRKVVLYTGSFMGLHPIYASTLVNVEHIVYVHDYPEHPVEEISAWNLKAWLFKQILTLIAPFPISIYRWGDVRIFGLRKGHQISFAPPSTPPGSIPLVVHDFDIVVLDFTFDGLPVKKDATLRKISAFLSGYNNPAVKPHPTFPGELSGTLRLPIIEPGIPAEALAKPGVHCLSLVSSAESAFERVIDVRQFLVFANDDDVSAWTAPDALIWRNNEWQVRGTLH